MTVKRICFLFLPVLFLLLAPKAKAQSFSMEFANHLLQNKLTDEAAAYLTQSLADSSNIHSRDTINHLLGNIYFDRQQHLQAYQYYTSVSDSFADLFVNKLRQAISLHSIQRSEEAYTLLNTIAPADSLELQILIVFKAAIALSQDNYNSYLSNDSAIAFNSFIYDDVRVHLKNIYTQKVSSHKKSPFLAGLYSAIIPGLGKVYAGKPYEGLSSFLQTGVLGAIVLENLLRAGPSSARFIVFGGLFGLFYVGNIWGSVVAVKVHEQQVTKQFNEEISRNLYITIRNYKG
jgi:hypothetical protein